MAGTWRGHGGNMVGSWQEHGVHKETMMEQKMNMAITWLLQYSDCLPTKLDTWSRHSIWKIISASRRIFWDGFQPSVSFSSLQYFDCLPTKLDTWCRHSIWKMISASRRIFWDCFQPFFKKCMIYGLVSLASVFRLFTHQTRHLVWPFNMENDQHIKAHLLRWFPAIFEKMQIFGFSVFDT